jgi:hypothetical protein
MKIFAASTLFTAAASAAAILEPRQGSGYCFVFARGSTEPSPIVCEYMSPENIQILIQILGNTYRAIT